MSDALSASKARVLSAKETAGFQGLFDRASWEIKKESILDHLKTVHGVILGLYFPYHMDAFIFNK